ncbi:MAG: hypothetical protein ACSLEM_00480 [Candidatus Malihini olakiniferum]
MNTIYEFCLCLCLCLCHAINRLPEEQLYDHTKCGCCGSELFSGEVINTATTIFDKLLQDTLP